MLIDTRCKTARCVADIEKYGERYHGVHALRSPSSIMPDAVACCERCGGHTNGSDWKHACKKCGKDVQPGELVGFFVPHRCVECDAKVVADEIARGAVCSSCGSVHSYCCC